MAHFIIHLPDNSELDVRSGNVLRKTLLGFFRINKLNDEVRKGYIIINKSNKKQYRFLKTQEGIWRDKNEAGFDAGIDKVSLLIKKEIDEFEKSLKFIPI